MTTISNLFDKTATIKRLSPDDSDADKEGYVVSTTSVSCHIQPASLEVIHFVDGAVFKTYTMWCAIGTDLLPNDRVVIGNDTYTVTGVDKWDMGTNPHVEAILQKGVAG